MEPLMFIPLSNSAPLAGADETLFCDASGKMIDWNAWNTNERAMLYTS